MFLELMIGALTIGAIAVFADIGNSDGAYDEGSSDYSSYDYFSDETSSEGYFGLHNASDRSRSGIALNNCENCYYYSGGECRWQENAYVNEYRAHQYVCSNYRPE